MKALNFSVPIIAGCCLAVLMATGCEENTTPTQNPPNVDVTGTWGMQADLEDVHTMVLNQSGNEVTGYISTFVGQPSTIVGIVSDISITMLMSFGTSNAVNTVNFSGLASDNSMSGTWRNSNDAEGTWTAIRK